MHAKSGGSCGEPPDFLFIPAACRSRKEPPRSVGGGDRARNTGNRPRDAEDGATGTGAGCGARETGARARAQGAGPRVRGAGRGCGTRKTRAWGAGRKTRNTWTRTRTRARARGHGVQETGHRRRGTSPRAWNATRPHTPRQAPQQPAWTVHSRAPSAAGRRYLSRVRIRITPLPPRTPYMLLPRCTSTDLTS